VEQQIRAMSAEGFSVREIARELGLSRMRVHRMLTASPSVPAVPSSAAADGDPVVALLTPADLACLGVTAGDVVCGISVLDR
jgi:hypothetical protein